MTSKTVLGMGEIRSKSGHSTRTIIMTYVSTTPNLRAIHVSCQGSCVTSIYTIGKNVNKNSLPLVSSEGPVEIDFIVREETK